MEVVSVEFVNLTANYLFGTKIYCHENFPQ